MKTSSFDQIPAVPNAELVPPVAIAPNPRGLAPLVAIVGCDGAGKSTLVVDLRKLLRGRRPVETRYLGLGTGDIGNRIRRWPLIGSRIERALTKKATQTRSKDQRIPGLLTALVVFGFSLLRRWRFQRVLALRRQGVMVITDRYPQIEVPGFYDGPGLSAARAGSSLVAWLAARERRMYVRMASYQPSLVLRLNIDAATAYSRKPDHMLGLLQKKVAATPLLSFGGARIVDLDARASYEEVRRLALQSIADVVGDAGATFRAAA